jgi:predicted RNA-binding protein YlxR (DUF448 family)
MPHVSERTCIGCRKPAPTAALCLLVAPAGVVALAPRSSALAAGRGGRRGRGAWVHPPCLEKVLANGSLNRAFRRQVEVSSRETLLAQMQAVFGHSLNVQGKSP